MSASGSRSRAPELAVAALVVGLVAGCGPGIKRGPDGEIIRTIRDVEIEGNKKLSDDRIEGGLATREPSGWIRRRHRRLDSIELERDRQRIESYYRRKGFFRARVTGVEVKEVGDRRADVIFTVKEGPRAKLSQILVTGAPGVPGLDDRAMRARAGLRRGQPFDYGDFEYAQRRLEDALIRAGYARARVRGRAEVDPDSLDVRIRLRIQPRKRTRFGPVEVTGTELVPESSVRARLSWEEGDWFDPQKVADSRRRLMRFGRFSTARIDLGGGPRSEVAPVRVTVTESPRNELRLGGGFGLDPANYLVRGRAGYTRHGVFDPLTTLNIDLRPAYALLRGTASFGYTLDEVEAYSTQGPKFGLSLARSLLAERIRIGVGWRFRLLQVFDVDDRVTPETRMRLGFESPYRIGWYEQSITYDGRDNPLDAKRGIYAQLRLEQGTPLAGSEFSYVLATPELRGYLPLGSPRVIGAARVRYGTTLRGTLPITQRYFAGGASSHRGFPQRHLSPVEGDVVTGAVGIGGDTLLETNVEARLDMFKMFGEWLGMVVFADGADVTLATGELSPSNLHWAAGAGLRYDTVVGPIRLDVGVRLNRLDDLDPGDRIAYHVSIGEAF